MNNIMYYSQTGQDKYLEKIGYTFLKLDIHDIFMIHIKSQFNK
jgi:hypothetical protein